MFCQNCGSNIPDGSSFCTVCGSPARSDSAPSPVSAPVTAPSKGPSASKINSKAIISIVLLVAIIGLAVFSYLKYFDGREDNEKIPAIFWVFCGVIAALVAALIITLLSGKKKKDSTSGAISATYSLAVNPLATPLETASASFDSVAVDNQPYSAPMAERIGYEPPLNGAPVVDPAMESNEVFSTHYADSTSDVNSNIETLYNNSEVVQTKYAPESATEPKKNVEIIFSPETSIPTVNSEEFTFTPGVAEKYNVSDATEALTNDEVSAAPVVSEAPVVSDTPTEPETPVVSPEPAAPAVFSEPEAPAAPVKASSSPFFKSAGDL